MNKHTPPDLMKFAPPPDVKTTNHEEIQALKQRVAALEARFEAYSSQSNSASNTDASG